VNLSLKNRVFVSFVVSNLVVLVLSFTVFHYLNSFNKSIEDVTSRTTRTSLLTDEIRITTITLLKRQKELFMGGAGPEKVQAMVSLCESFVGQLRTLDTLLQDSNAKKVAAQMISYVESLKLFLNKSSLSGRDSAGLASVGDLADKILESFSELQDIQYDQSKADNKRIKRIIDETKRNMMITLIIGFLGTIILGLVVPGKIALPFKKIRDAIRELQDCNFDVSIYYNQDDEIGEIAREMNKMIHSFKIFDGLRADRINVERRKFDALANMVKKPVLVANAMGEVIYMNSKVYGLMNVQSEDVIGKNMLQTPLDPSVIESFELAIKRRSKIENAEIQITAKREASSESELNQIQDQVNELGETIQGAGLPDEVVFSGFANVVPIRGKESSLDYYLMVLSNEVFA
jgi:hypothetical protein